MTYRGTVKMLHLFVLRAGMKSIAACLAECIIPHIKGKDTTAEVPA